MSSNFKEKTLNIMDMINLNSFLKFGYFLDYKNPDICIDFSEIDKSKYRDYSEEELINKGISIWREAVEKDFKSNEKHVVPLSGGFDSRAILATLLEFTESKNIYTYTFGTPGSYDYDIAKLIANKASTNHISLPLTEHHYNINEEILFSNRTGHQTLVFLHPPLNILDDIFSGYNIWSGFNGGTFTDDYVEKYNSSNINMAFKNFIKKNSFVKSINLTNISNNKYFSLIDYLEDKNVIIPLDMNFDFFNRQKKYIAPHVLFEGFNYKQPCLNNSWNSFFLSLDDEFRHNQYLYKKILYSSYTELFQLPNKKNMGLPLCVNNKKIILKKIINKGKLALNKLYPIFLNKGINYIDFNEGIRNRKDLGVLVYNSIMDLKGRGIVNWIDIDGIWQRHINYKVNHADALITLASLEIHLKAGKKI